MKMAKDGDEIHIDYAQGSPYLECENVIASCAIELTKSLSFHGLNGTSEIQCRKCSNFFTITNPSFDITRIKFFNLVISKSNIVAELGAKARTELSFQNMLVKDNNLALYSKRSTDCSIKILNSSFDHNFNSYWGIYLQCTNLTVHMNSASFIFTPVLFTNVGNEPTRWTKTEILVEHTTFNDKKIQKCSPMFTIKSFAAVLNVTIMNSEFKNHLAYCNTNQVSTALIYDYRLDVRNITFILFDNMTFENNYNNWGSLSLYAGCQDYAKVDIKIKKSIFRNNSVALRVSTYCPKKGYSVELSPTIILENNTFEGNFYDISNVNGAPAVYFHTVKSRVLSCHFHNNRPGPNPYTGVVTISKEARVTFINCYFQNRQTTERANQLFASGNEPVYFDGENTFNFVALKGSQTVFSRVPTIFDSRVIMKNNFKIKCPQGFKVNTQGECATIKTAYECYYIIVQCEQCPAKTYTIERGDFIFNKSNDIQCQKCPRGGDCDSGLVKAKPNFWGFNATTKLIFFQCPPGYCCNNEDCITYDSCHGNRSGTLCGGCPEGMSESLFSTRCISNKECFLDYFFIFDTIALLVLYLVLFLYHKEIVNILHTSLFTKRLWFTINSRNEQRNNSSANQSLSRNGMIQIFFYFYQVSNLLRSSVGLPENSLLIHEFEKVISGVMNIVLVNLSSFNCPLKDLRAVPKAVLIHSLGYILLGILCLFYLISKLILMLTRLRNDRGTASQNITTRPGQRSSVPTSSFSQRVASAFTYTSLLMYASSAKLCLSLLHCVPVGNNQVLFLDGNIKCYETFQYFFLGYMISSILPFCLVPVLGSYLLKFRRIGVKQFYVACIFPLPFCCFWMYLLVKDYRCGSLTTYNTLVESDNEVRSEQSNNENSLGDEEITVFVTDGNERASNSIESAILKVLLGPFRPHQTFMCFPSLHIPWEGFLIFRRLVLIIVLTFVYDIQLKLFLALILCVAILILHMLVNPFQRKLDNVLESFSLGTHVVLCGSTLIKCLYYGEDYSSFSKSLQVLNVIETVLIVTPLSIIVIVVIFSIVIKFVLGLKLCFSVLTRRLVRLAR